MNWLKKNWRDLGVIGTICVAIVIGAWNLKATAQNTKAVEELTKITTVQVKLNERNIQWREDHEKLHEIERLMLHPK